MEGDVGDNIQKIHEKCSRNARNNQLQGAVDLCRSLRRGADMSEKYPLRLNSERVLLLFTVFSAERPHFGKGIQVFLIYSLIAVHISRLRTRKLADISGEPF